MTQEKQLINYANWRYYDVLLYKSPQFKRYNNENVNQSSVVLCICYTRVNTYSRCEKFTTASVDAAGVCWKKSYKYVVLKSRIRVIICIFSKIHCSTLLGGYSIFLIMHLIYDDMVCTTCSRVCQIWSPSIYLTLERIFQSRMIFVVRLHGTPP